MGLHLLTVAEASRLIRARELSSLELTRAVLEQVERTQPHTCAYTEVAHDAALRAAAEADGRPAAEPLHGIPMAIKDIIDVEGMATRAGSASRADAPPAARDARVTSLLRRAGAVILGKTVTHEFAMGTTSPPARNAWDAGRIPGGSSGGAAAAVATGACLAAIGTDTGCSIRLPAALNGVAGLKPTYGRVSTSGVYPLSWTHDHVGPIARTAEDCALVLQAIAGHDPGDATTSAAPVDDYARRLRDGVAGLRLGVPSRYFLERNEPAVDGAVRAAIGVLAGAGAEIVELDIPDIEHGMSVVRVCAVVEGAAVHRRAMRAGADGYTPLTRSLFEAGLLVPAADYLDALRMRERVRAAVQAAFARHRLDALLTPASPVTALPVGTEVHAIGDGPELVVDFHHMAYLSPFNTTGQPALSIPCGFDGQGLPIGLQVVGRPFAEATVLRIACAYEQLAGWHLRHPATPGDTE